MNQFTIWLHVLGVIISLGSGLFLVLVLFPSLKAFPDPTQRMKILSENIKFFHPLYLFGICLSFVTGAIRLTDLKIGFGPAYYSALGHVLMWKFGMTTAIFMVASMQCFGMGLKFSRMINGVIPSDLALQERYAQKIRKATIANVVLLAITLYIGLKLVPIIY